MKTTKNDMPVIIHEGSSHYSKKGNKIKEHLATVEAKRIVDTSATSVDLRLTAAFKTSYFGPPKKEFLVLEQVRLSIDDEYVLCTRNNT